jgi:hypothetical protein
MPIGKRSCAGRAAGGGAHGGTGSIYVTIRTASGTSDVAVVLGEGDDNGERVEILTGLRDGDRVVSCHDAASSRYRRGLTRAFIRSPLTPLFLLAALALGLVALLALPREEEPQISVPMVDIHVRAERT